MLVVIKKTIAIKANADVNSPDFVERTQPDIPTLTIKLNTPTP